MTFTADSARNFFRNLSSYSTQAGDVVENVIAVFKSLSVDEQLAVLWFTYNEMGCSITPVATGSARLKFAIGLINQIKLMSHEEQLQAMRDLAAQKNTQISRSYGVLSPNTKLAFWYELSELIVKGVVIPIPTGYQLSLKGKEVIETLKQLDFAQQITLLRKVVIDMGVDPFTK
ncbi:MAG: orange carotenoid protein N-terminal domain-containing protein [Mastigocoleus sp. MO_167.B18]|nr:orange carotenoid protein N-terminal domain-containing protein [Mastigocoleus sp. MO_167.B18]